MRKERSVAGSDLPREHDKMIFRAGHVAAAITSAPPLLLSVGIPVQRALLAAQLALRERRQPQRSRVEAVRRHEDARARAHRRNAPAERGALLERGLRTKIEFLLDFFGRANPTPSNPFSYFIERKDARTSS